MNRKQQLFIYPCKPFFIKKLAFVFHFRITYFDFIKYNFTLLFSIFTRTKPYPEKIRLIHVPLYTGVLACLCARHMKGTSASATVTTKLHVVVMVTAGPSHQSYLQRHCTVAYTHTTWALLSSVTCRPCPAPGVQLQRSRLRGLGTVIPNRRFMDHGLITGMKILLRIAFCIYQHLAQYFSRISAPCTVFTRASHWASLWTTWTQFTSAPRCS
jgi:hypothetical protein